MATYDPKFVKRIAVGVLHLMTGNALMSWPTTSAAHPSIWAIVGLSAKGPIWEAAKAQFPIQVSWYFWDDVVVPVIQENALKGNNNLQALFNTESYEDLVDHYQALLSDKAKSKGYLPTDEL